MEIEKLHIGGIPALLWGKESRRLILAAHGSHSSKLDDCIWVLAEEAAAKGFRVLSFDLPQHGERVYEEAPLPSMVEVCRRELEELLDYARQRYEEVSFFGCSMGAYFGLLAYGDRPIERAWFLSPVTDMEELIRGLMAQFGITEDALAEKKVIPTPFETLFWDYYAYVKTHPIRAWPHPTHILRGEGDTLCPRAGAEAFADRFGCTLTEQPGGEHWFHTSEELAFYREWLRSHL